MLGIVNILIVLLSIAIIGGFLDFLWHTGKLMRDGENGVTRAIFLFFLSILLWTSWAITEAILNHYGMYNEYINQMQLWLVFILVGVLGSLVYLRLTLFDK